MNCHVTTTSPLPRSHVHALWDSNWKEAMLDEYNALITNRAWVLMPCPANVNVFRSMWLFNHKFYADGSLGSPNLQKRFLKELIRSIAILAGLMLILNHLEEIHGTWAHLEKKRTRLWTNTKTLEDLCLQRLETASPTLHDAVTTYLVTALQHFMTASARADSHVDLEYSTHDGVLIKT
ncbi:ribonuclease H-like domain-containing protein [Tanacetum coccineum]|uniref:Ribonuclease H-like domain-containing protein n=1 Tax=Tanacetum coccineum TaxID=301880 RepID=A0ABQ4XHB2_9ASTR